MVSQKVTIKNPSGLHVGPAGFLCQTAMKFDSKITFSSGKGTESNAKSFLSVLGAGVRFGDELEFFCEGSDEEAALAEMVHAVENGLEDFA